MPPNWNEYINIERTNKYKANNLKQDEKQIVKLVTRGKAYEGKYPLKVVFRPHYSSLRQDLDNFRYKGLLDGLVANGVIENDNLKHIQEIVIKPIFDSRECVEIEISPLKRQRDLMEVEISALESQRDLVEVVRCRDCNKVTYKNDKMCWCNYYHQDQKPDYYCNYGQPRSATDE